MELSVDDDGPTYSAIAFDKSCDRIFLKPSAYDNTLAIAATSTISLSPALSLGFQLAALGKPMTIVRHGRPIIPLTRHTDGNSFREVTRVTLLETTLSFAIHLGSRKWSTISPNTLDRDQVF